MISRFFENSRPSASNFKSFSRSLDQFFLTVGQNNFGNKIPMFVFNHFWIFCFTNQIKAFLSMATSKIHFYLLQMVTRAPADCMCRPCTALEDDNVMPSEIAGYINADDMLKHFVSIKYQK